MKTLPFDHPASIRRSENRAARQQVARILFGYPNYSRRYDRPDGFKLVKVEKIDPMVYGLTPDQQRIMDDFVRRTIRNDYRTQLGKGYLQWIAADRIWKIDLRMISEVTFPVVLFMRRYLVAPVVFLYDLIPHTSYYSVFSRDCDMCESTRSERFTNRRQVKRYYDDLCENAEGAIGMTRISREQYREFHPSSRDRVMEAYENGNGYSIYV